MKVLLFTEVILPYISGVSSYVDVLKKGLEKLGHQVVVATSSVHVKKPVFKNGVIFCPARKANNKYGFEYKGSFDNIVFDYLKVYRPDIIHIHTDTKIGYLGLAVADVLHLPVVYTIHDYYNDRFAADDSHFIWSIKTNIEKNHFIDMLDNADVVTSSCSRASIFVKRAGRQRKVMLVPTTTDSSRFDYTKSNRNAIRKIRIKYGLSQNATVAVFAGGLSVEKNLEFVLTAFERHIRKNDNIQFLIVGNGSEMHHLKSLCKKLKLNDRVFFTGAVAHSMMPEIYNACDVYVCSSEDGLMSMSYIEAIACGLPVLIKEDREEIVYKLIQNGVNGFVYTNQAEFATYLKKLSSLDEKSKRQVRRVVRNTLKDVEDTDMAKKYLIAYKAARRIYRMKNNNVL